MALIDTVLVLLLLADSISLVCISVLLPRFIAKSCYILITSLNRQAVFQTILGVILAFMLYSVLVLGYFIIVFSPRAPGSHRWANVLN